MKNLVRFAAPLALVLSLALFASARLAPAAAASRHYVSPPCGLPCDDAVYDAPGTCPRCGMALIEQEKAASMTRRASKKVALLIFTGVEIIDYTAPYEVFGHTDLDVYTVAETKEPVTTVMGMTVVPKYSFADAPPADVLIVPGGGIDGARNSAPTMKWIRETAGHAELTMSVCNGAFLLAGAGLLDGLTATTTAGRIDQLAAEFPKVRVVRDQRYVDNGRIITTAGLSSGIDGALHVVERLFGKGTAQDVALMIEYDWRPGSGFARAAMADRLIPDVSMREIGDWHLERTEGTRDHWEKVARGTSDRTAGEIRDFIGRAFERAHWVPGANPASQGTGATAAGDWSLRNQHGEAWIAKLTVEPVAGEGQSYRIHLTIARAAAARSESKEGA